MTDKKDSFFQTLKDKLIADNLWDESIVEKELIEQNIEKEQEKKEAQLKAKKPRPHKALQLSGFDISELTLEDIEQIKKQLEKDGLNLYSLNPLPHDGLTEQEEANRKYASEIVRRESYLQMEDMYNKEFIEEHEKSHLYHIAMSPLTHALVHRLGMLGYFDDQMEDKGTTNNQDEADEFMQEILKLHLDIEQNQFGSKPNAIKGAEWEECWKYPKEDTLYFYLHGYLLFEWHNQNNVEKYLHLKDFLTWDKEFGEGIHTLDSLKALIKNHSSKPSTTGITKKLEKHTPITAGKYFQDAIADYIELQKELGIPTIDEDLNSSGRLNFAKFWWLYGTTAHSLNPYEYGTSARTNIFLSAFERFKEKVTDDEAILYPMLQYLYNEYSEDADFIKEITHFNPDDTGYATRGLGSHRFARKLIDGYQSSKQDEYEMLMVRRDEEYRDRVVNSWHRLLFDWPVRIFKKLYV